MSLFLLLGLYPALHKFCVSLKTPILENHVTEGELKNKELSLVAKKKLEKHCKGGIYVTQL